MPLLGSWYRGCICLEIPIHLPVLGSKNLRFIASTVLLSLLILRHTRAPFLLITLGFIAALGADLVPTTPTTRIFVFCRLLSRLHVSLTVH